jgi:putative FmdB family regulatory protein
MPTYDFVCPARHEFERFFRKISNAPLEMPCPECGAIAIRKVSGGAGLHFKGSGFYITDYGKDGKKQQGQPPTKDASTPAASGASDASTSTGGDAPKDSAKDSPSPKSTPPSSGSSGGE